MQTSITPSPNSAEPIALLPCLTPSTPTAGNQSSVNQSPVNQSPVNLSPIIQLPITLPPPPKPKDPFPAKLIIGKIHLRTPEEEAQFQECERTIGEGLKHFARVGEALATIRDKKLYKVEYQSFEVYCRERWDFGRVQACRYIAAAQVHKAIAIVPGLPVPECEAQVRPLVGLSDELAQEAWLKALGWSRESYVPPRLVKRAAKQVLRAQQPAVAAEAKADKKQRSRLRQSVRAGFQELLTLLLGNAQRDVLVAKVQEIQQLLEPLLAPKKTNW